MTQTQMADKLGISKQKLCDFEKGRRLPSVKMVAKWARMLRHPQAVWIQIVLQDQLRRDNLKLKVSIASLMNKKTRKYEDSLIESLKDPVEAAVYLSVYLEDDSPHAEETFLLALQDVAKAYGISEVAKKAKVGRESLYKIFSGSVNPKLKTLKKLLDTVGLKITIEPKEVIVS